MPVQGMHATLPATWNPPSYTPPATDAEKNTDIVTEIKLPPPKYEIVVVETETRQINEKETYTADEPIEDINLLYDIESPYHERPSAQNGGSLVTSPSDRKNLANVVGYFNNRFTDQVKSFIKPDAIYDVLQKIFISSKQTDTFKNLINIYERINNDRLKNKFMPNVVEEVKDFISRSSVHIHDGLIAIDAFDAYQDAKSIPEDIRLALREKMLAVKSELEDLSLPINEEIQENPLPDFKFLENNFSQLLGSLAVLGGASLLAAPIWVPIALITSVCAIKTVAPLLRQRAAIVIEDKKEVKEKCIDLVISKLSRRIKMLGAVSNGSPPASPTLSAANTAALNADIAAKRAAAAEEAAKASQAETSQTRRELADVQTKLIASEERGQRLESKLDLLISRLG